MLKKSIMSMLSLVIVGSVIAGCSGNNQNNADQPTPISESGNSYKDKYDPPVTISTARAVYNEQIFKDGEDMENNVHNTWALEELGIDIDTLWSITDVNGAFETKLRLSLTSGQTDMLPDVVTVSNVLAQELIQSGIYGEVGDLFDKYANQSWKDALALDPNVWNPVTVDGKRMGIPIMGYAYNNDSLLWIRQDWLDKLGLQAPSTLDELETVMDAFKNKNPDGLEPNNVTPLSIGFKNRFSTWMGDLSWLFGAYGTIPNQWNLDESGNLEYGSINPGSKEVLKKLNEWHTKGYIPVEAALWDENKTSEPAVAGTAGIIPGPYWMSGWPLLHTKENVEHAVWKPYLIPTGPDGKAGRQGSPFSSSVILLKKDMKHPEAFFTYGNFMYEHIADPEIGGPYQYGMFRGYDYELGEDGKPLPWEDNPDFAGTTRLTLFGTRPIVPDAQMKALLSLAAGNEPTTPLEIEISTVYGAETAFAAQLVMEQQDSTFINQFTGANTPTMKTRWDYLEKLEMQAFNDIIYGKKDANSFDDFVKTWKSSGGEEITKEVNDWHEQLQ